MFSQNEKKWTAPMNSSYFAYKVFLNGNKKSEHYHWILHTQIAVAGFELVKQNRFAKICKRNKEKGLPKKFLGFVNHFMKNVKDSNPLSANITKWSNILKQFIGKLPTNCLSVVDHFVGLALKGLIKFCKLIWLSFPN